MKKNYHIYWIALFVLLASCMKEQHINLGFDTPIEKNSSGMLIAHISRDVNSIYLTGYVSLTAGEVHLSLLNSVGFAVYSKTVTAPVELQISEMYEAKSGCWKLEYTSKGGVGNIDIQIHNR
jgi:hypothetical protein